MKKPALFYLLPTLLITTKRISELEGKERGE